MLSYRASACEQIMQSRILSFCSSSACLSHSGVVPKGLDISLSESLSLLFPLLGSPRSIVFSVRCYAERGIASASRPSVRL